MAGSSIMARLFRSVLSAFRGENKTEPAKKGGKPANKKQRKAKPPIKRSPRRPSEPEKPLYTSVQMPAPWSKVEKYKRIKKEGQYDY